MVTIKIQIDIPNSNLLKGSGIIKHSPPNNLENAHTERMATMTVKDIPPEIRQGFKAWCALHGKTEKSAVIDFMAEKAREVKLEKQK